MGIPCIGTLSCAVQPAPYQYSFPTSDFGGPSFLNRSNQSIGGLGGNNNGAYGLRFVWTYFPPYDGSGDLVQIAGGSISRRGVCNAYNLLRDPSKYGAIGSGNRQALKLADGPDGTILADCGADTAGRTWGVYRMDWPVDLAADRPLIIGSKAVNSWTGYAGGLNWDGHVNVVDPSTGITGRWTRNPQRFFGGDFPSPMFCETDPGGLYLNSFWQVIVPQFFGLIRETMAGFCTANGYLNLQSSQGQTAIFWNAGAGQFACVPYWLIPAASIVGQSSLDQPTPLLNLANDADDTAFQSNSNAGCLIPGGHYLFAPVGSATYFLILADLSAYYRVQFNATNAATLAAIEGQDSGFNAGFGVDIDGNFWFQDSAHNLYSSLGLDDFKLFNFGNFAPLPYLDYAATNCRRLLKSFNLDFEG